MKRIFLLPLLILLASCNNQAGKKSAERIITVSIAPYKYFVDAIGGGDFTVNVMVPPGSDPHVYEPVPVQIQKLRASEGYISNGYLGFEMVWLDRFYETNPEIKKLNLGGSIDPIETGHHHEEGDHVEGADPHYWVSPKCALKMAQGIRDFLQELNPPRTAEYESNYNDLADRISGLDRQASELFGEHRGKSFMIYHPNLAYLARDYGLKEIALESEGKEPSPSMMKDLIDLSRKDSITTILVQREYDTRNARSIADETGAQLVIIDPLAEDWYASTSAIIEALHESMRR